MALDMNTGIPSIRQLQTLIRDEHQVEIKLSTGDVLTGKLRWQDNDCVCVMDANSQPTIIWRHALAYLKPMI
ncbi:MAG: RNA-binding protein hfq [Merismopedia sp. SIO2A8]|nr:RNA-binding protein hfq [Merismopedia sp. SIO2A8]